MEDLRRKLKDLDEKLNVMYKDLESFRKKEAMNGEEIAKNVEKLDEIDAFVEAWREEEAVSISYSLFVNFI